MRFSDQFISLANEIKLVLKQEWEEGRRDDYSLNEVKILDATKTIFKNALEKENIKTTFTLPTLSPPHQEKQNSLKKNFVETPATKFELHYNFSPSEKNLTQIKNFLTSKQRFTWIETFVPILVIGKGRTDIETDFLKNMTKAIDQKIGSAYFCETNSLETAFHCKVIVSPLFPIKKETSFQLHTLYPIENNQFAFPLELPTTYIKNPLLKKSLWRELKKLPEKLPEPKLAFIVK